MTHVCRGALGYRGTSPFFSVPVFLRRGQLGTIVMTYDGRSFEVELADANGSTYASLPLPAERLMRLRDEPDLAVA